MKKTIVITGASRGIGKAIAIELAGKDTNIVINCVNNVDKLNEVKSIIEEKGSVCETFIGDMGNYSDVQKMFDMCLQRFGQVDVLVPYNYHLSDDEIKKQIQKKITEKQSECRAVINIDKSYTG